MKKVLLIVVGLLISLNSFCADKYHTLAGVDTTGIREYVMTTIKEMSDSLNADMNDIRMKMYILDVNLKCSIILPKVQKRLVKMQGLKSKYDLLDIYDKVQVNKFIKDNTADLEYVFKEFQIGMGEKYYTLNLSLFDDTVFGEFVITYKLFYALKIAE